MPVLRFSPAVAPTACCALAAALAPLSGGARAADVAPSLKASETLTPDQITAINTQVMRAVNQIKSGLPEDVSIGREWLVKELRTPGASVAYKNALARIVLPAADDLLKSPSALVRVNITMVVARVDSIDAATTLLPALTDKAEGVRWAAANAMHTVIEPSSSDHRNLSVDREKEVLKVLSAQAGQEANDAVFGAMVDLAAAINTPASQEALLLVLDAHLPQLVDQPEKSFRTPGNGINTLYKRFLKDSQNGPLMPHLMTTALRYERLACQQLVADPKNARLIADRRDLLLTCDKILHAQYAAVGGTGTLPADAQGQISLSHWKEVLGIIVQWADLFKQAPFLMKD